MLQLARNILSQNMKIYIKKAVFVNRAPLDRLELDFNENEVSVLSAVNGREKLLSCHILLMLFMKWLDPIFKMSSKVKKINFMKIGE